jgi:hypothetical protein
MSRRELLKFDDGCKLRRFLKIGAAMGAAPNGRVSAKPCCSPSVAARSSSGRVKHGLGGEGEVHGGPGQHGQLYTARARQEQDSDQDSAQDPEQALKERKRHATAHATAHATGPHRDCTVPREAATGPLRTSSAARALSFSLPCSPRCLAPSLPHPLAPSLTRFPAVSCASSCSHSLA